MNKSILETPLHTNRPEDGALGLARVKMPPLVLSLQFADTRHKTLLRRDQVARWIRKSLDPQHVESAQINVRIVDAPEGCQLNTQYRHKNYATNVLTFDYTHGPELAADLVICAPVVAQEAQEQGKTIQAHYAHLLVHGTLHAQGWDHESDTEAQQMEACEIRILANLGFTNPYN